MPRRVRRQLKSAKFRGPRPDWRPFYRLPVLRRFLPQLSEAIAALPTRGQEQKDLPKGAAAAATAQAGGRREPEDSNSEQLVHWKRLGPVEPMLTPNSNVSSTLP